MDDLTTEYTKYAESTESTESGSGSAHYPYPVILMFLVVAHPVVIR